jgi:glycosyltransferase involved in cell wall biosynthesis
MISIIIPVFNVKSYLRQCIDSVINQSYTDIEILLIDDGSTDGSSEICDKYALQDKRITVIHQKNQGQGNARNVGIDRSHGEFIYFLDSDDWIKPKLFEAVIAHMKRNSLDLCFFGATVKNDTIDISWNEDMYRKTLGYKIGSGAEILKQQFDKHEYSATVYLYIAHGDLIRNSKIRFQEDILFEDNLFTFQLVLTSQKCDVLAESLYIRRIRENSTMTAHKDIQRKVQSYIQVIAGLEKIKFKEAFVKEYKRKYIYSCIRSILYYAIPDHSQWLVASCFILSRYLFINWKMPIVFAVEFSRHIIWHIKSIF